MPRRVKGGFFGFPEKPSLTSDDETQSLFDPTNQGQTQPQAQAQFAWMQQPQAQPQLNAQVQPQGQAQAQPNGQFQPQGQAYSANGQVQPQGQGLGLPAKQDKNAGLEKYVYNVRGGKGKAKDKKK